MNLALVYATNPVRSTPALLPLGIAPPGPTLLSDKLSVGAFVGGQFIQAAFKNEEGDFVTPPRAPGGDLSVDPFAEASAYFHAGKAFAYFESLGATPRPLDILTGFRPTAEPFASSVYLPPANPTERGRVFLGRGPTREIAYDGDIVAREVAHAVLDGKLPPKGYTLTAYGASIANESLGDAIADYYAAAISGDPVLDEWAALEEGSEGQLRSIDNSLTCPAQVNGNAVDESLLISGALWKLRAIDPFAFDKRLFDAITSVGTSDVFALANASFAGEALLERGVGCAPIAKLVAGDTLRATRSPYAAPGLDAIRVGDLAPGVVQVEVAIPPATGKLDVRFTVRKRFAPVVVTSFDAPIQWSAATIASTPTEGDDVTQHAVIDVPFGAKVVFVQIANRDNPAGSYNDISVKVAGPAPRAISLEGGGPKTDCAFHSAHTSGAEWLLALGVVFVTARRWLRRPSR